ncbi:MAG: XdhC/CoxI family protein [Actinomycetota bacterium]
MNNAAHRVLLEELTAAVRAGRCVATATVVETSGSVPRRPGAKMLVLDDGATSGTIGGGKVEALVISDALDAIATGDTRLTTYKLQEPLRGDPGVCGGTMTIALEPYMPPPTVFVIGAGHVGRAVIDLAHWLGYRTVAVDDRADLVTTEALPNADVLFAGNVAAAVEAHPITADTSVIVVTRSFEMDAQIVPLILSTPARYIGVMGSARRWSSTRDALGGADISDDDLARIHAPIGLEIGAESVEEIAVSIMSEVIATSGPAGRA